MTDSGDAEAGSGESGEDTEARFAARMALIQRSLDVLTLAETHESLGMVATVPGAVEIFEASLAGEFGEIPPLMRVLDLGGLALLSGDASLLARIPIPETGESWPDRVMYTAALVLVALGRPETTPEAVRLLQQEMKALQPAEEKAFFEMARESDGGNGPGVRIAAIRTMAAYFMLEAMISIHEGDPSRAHGHLRHAVRCADRVGDIFLHNAATQLAVCCRVSPLVAGRARIGAPCAPETGEPSRISP